MAEMIPVVPSAQLEEMEPFCIEREGVPYCVIKVGEQINAYVSICTHKELAMFPPKIKQGLLVCPHHKVGFDPATGEVVEDCGKSVEALLPVKVEILNEMVHLEMRKRHRKMVPKSERRWVEKLWKKLQRKEHKEEERMACESNES